MTLNVINANAIYVRIYLLNDVPFLFNSGIWNVPYVVGCYLVKKSILPLMKFEDDNFEPDMALCKQMRLHVS